MFSDQQQRDVEQQRGEVVVGDDVAVDREDERLLAELRDVLQDAPQVGQFHRQPRFILSAAAGRGLSLPAVTIAINAIVGGMCHAPSGPMIPSRPRPFLAQESVHILALPRLLAIGHGYAVMQDVLERTDGALLAQPQQACTL